MADFKYIMQGFQKDINFFDEIKEVLETEDYKKTCTGNCVLSWGRAAN